MTRFLMLTSLFALCLSIQAADPRIPAGLDTWQTIGGGATQMSFDEEPIPADFFCQGSSAFTGTIYFEGVPLATEPAGMFGRTDTIVARLDDALVKDGRGFSRLQIQAMHLASRTAVQTDCGLFTVRVGLTEDQPITTIDYIMEGEKHGVFNADLVLTARMSFISVDDPTDVRVLDRTVHFTEFIHTPFHLRGPTSDKPEFVRGKRNNGPGGSAFQVDTDADDLPDKVLRLENELIYVDGYYCEDSQYQQILRPDENVSCVEETVTHQSPTDAHTTTPTNPNCIICPEQYDSLENPHKRGNRTARQPIDGNLSSGGQIALLEQLRQMEAAGTLIIPAEQVLEELVAKGTR